MRIVFISNWHSENMGYSDNMLPKAIAHLGHEVHLIASTAQIYYNSPLYDKTYRSYLGEPIVPEGSKTVDGYTLHRLPFHSGREITIKGLIEKISELQPDVVQTFDINSSTYPLALARKKIGYKLFTEVHLHASVFPNYDKRSLYKKLKWFVRFGRLLGKINRETTLCYPIAKDCADIARVLYDVPESKIRVQSLGTDTQLFKPASTTAELERRISTRKKFGFSNDDIVCIYTGRIAKDKGPSILAKAIGHLHDKGEKQYKGLFVGTGDPEEMELISNMHGCVVKDFVPVFELPVYYQASDIAVWPAQESTSQLDAIACGLPLIINDTITIKERIEGNGLLYKLNDSTDLAEKLLTLKSAEKRASMGKAGEIKAEGEFSWIKIAKSRILDYSAALQ